MSKPTTLAGRYRVVRELGRGASGRVVAAIDTLAEGQPERAIKLVAREHEAELRWELDLLRGLSHPCLAAVYELVSIASSTETRAAHDSADPRASVAGLVCELAPGKPASVRARALAAGSAELHALVLRVACDVASALAALHARGLVHGDVKPDNIVVSDALSEQAARCKLVDLGLAARAGVASNGLANGTPSFMAPESFLGERSAASDMYALGATLAALLRGSSAAATLHGSASETSRRSAGEFLRASLQAHREPLPVATPPALARLIADLLEPRAELRLKAAAQVVARVLSMAEALATPLGPSIGGGVDDTASPAERAATMQALPFVGHTDALAALRDALCAPCVITLIGPVGSGRSRLVREAMAARQAERIAAGQSAPTYIASAQLPEGALPSALSRPSARAHEPACCIHVTAADALSARDVHAFVRSADVQGVPLVLVLERTQPLPFADPLDVLGSRAISLAPLREGEVRKLLEHALPGVNIARALVQEALAVSAGLSGALCRVLALALAAGTPIEHAGALRAALQAPGKPAGGAATGAVLVPPSARELVALLCVAGGELDMAVLHHALGRDADVQAQARPLRELGLAILDGDRLALRPDLVSALRAELLAPAARALAERIVGALDPRLDARALGYAEHARGSSSASLAAFLLAIERARAAGQPERAALIAAEAQALVADERLSFARADALRAAGRYPEASAVLADSTSVTCRVLFAEVARLSGAADREAIAERAFAATQGARDEQPTAAREQARAILARLAFDRGDLERAELLAREALSLSQGATHAEAALRACEVLALCALARGERADASHALAEAEARARSARLVAAEARVLAMQAQLARDGSPLRGAGRPSAIERLVRSVELADAAGERHAAASFLHNLGVQQLEAGLLGAAAVSLRDAARRLARLGRDTDLSRALLNVGLCAQLSGATDLALDAATRSQQTAVSAGEAVTGAYAACLLVELQLERGDLRAAIASLDALTRALPDPTRLPGTFAGSIAARIAGLHAQLGDVERSASLLAIAEQAETASESSAFALELGLAQCRLARERGRSEEALLAAERARSAAERDGGFDARLRAGLAAAAAARAAGDSALATARLSDVRTLLDAAALSLPSEARAALRALPAYRAALEAAPAREPAHDVRVAHEGHAPRLLQIAKRLAAEHRLARLYELVLDASIELIGAERGYLVLQDRDGVPQVRATRGLSRPALQHDLERGELSPSSAILGRVLATGRPLSTVDAAHDERLSSSASVHRLALRSVVAVPLRLRGELRGALYLEDRLRPFAFGEAETLLLGELAELAGSALDSAQLVRAERRACKRLEIARTRLDRTVRAQAAELASFRASDPTTALKHVEAGRRGANGLHGMHGMHGIVACSPNMQRALALALKVATSDLPVLLRGESGTGKELLARAIHAASARKSAPFVTENCGAIQESLLESTLFGHVKGAFTGADRRHLGLFELADGGTLLLDEIAEMSPSMQVRLLRVLQDGEVRPVGGERSRRVDVRVLAATHRDLEAMVRDGRFREDLYYRLSVVTVDIPPLRERHEDLAPLVHALIAKHAAGRRIAIDPGVIAALSRSAFPGNVRQLENELRRALALCGDQIGLSHLSSGLLAGTEPAADPLDLRAQIDALERRLIRQALEASAGNQTRAARMLGVSRFGLQKMIRRLGAAALVS